MEGVNRKTVTEIFENPITGIKDKMQVSCAFTDQQIENLKTYNLDVNMLLDNAINRELEYSKGKKFIDAIVDYANGNYVNANEYGNVKTNITLNQAAPHQILSYIKSFLFSCKSPKLYTNPYVLTVLNDVLENKNFDKQNQGYYYFAGEVKLKRKDVDKREDVELTVPVYCIPYMRWDETEVIMFDDDDRKRCQVMKFNFETEKEAK